MRKMIAYCGLDCENAMRILQRCVTIRHCVKKPRRHAEDIDKVQ